LCAANGADRYDRTRNLLDRSGKTERVVNDSVAMTRLSENIQIVRGDNVPFVIAPYLFNQNIVP